MERLWIAVALFLLFSAQAQSQTFFSDESTRCDIERTSKYEVAYFKSIAEGKPLLIFLTSKSCQPCKAWAASVLDPMNKAKAFDDLVYVVIDAEEDKWVASQLMNETKIRTVPQLLAYDHVASKLHSISGVKPLATVRELLRKLTPRVQKTSTP